MCTEKIDLKSGKEDTPKFEIPKFLKEAKGDPKNDVAREMDANYRVAKFHGRYYRIQNDNLSTAVILSALGKLPKYSYENVISALSDKHLSTMRNDLRDTMYVLMQTMDTEAKAKLISSQADKDDFKSNMLPSSKLINELDAEVLVSSMFTTMQNLEAVLHFGQSLTLKLIVGCSFWINLASKYLYNN